jgi:hypothetical protein
VRCLNEALTRATYGDPEEAVLAAEAGEDVAAAEAWREAFYEGAAMEEMRLCLALLKKDDKTIMRMRDEGRTQDEIGAFVGLRQASVSGRISSVQAWLARVVPIRMAVKKLIGRRQVPESFDRDPISRHVWRMIVWHHMPQTLVAKTLVAKKLDATQGKVRGKWVSGVAKLPAPLKQAIEKIDQNKWNLPNPDRFPDMRRRRDHLHWKVKRRRAMEHDAAVVRHVLEELNHISSLARFSAWLNHELSDALAEEGRPVRTKRRRIVYDGGANASKGLGIDLSKHYEDVRRITYHFAGAWCARWNYPIEDFVSDMCQRIMVRNNGTCPYDPSKAKLSHYVVIMIRQAIASQTRHMTRCGRNKIVWDNDADVVLPAELDETIDAERAIAKVHAHPMGKIIIDGSSRSRNGIHHRKWTEMRRDLYTAITT